MVARLVHLRNPTMFWNNQNRKPIRNRKQGHPFISFMPENLKGVHTGGVRTFKAPVR
jgi:hypothetical protein